MNNIRFEEQEFYNWLQTTKYNGLIGLTAKFYVRDGKVPKFLEIMKNNVEFTNTEVGVRLYKLYGDYENPLIYWLIEEWDTVTDLKNHCTSETYVKNGKLLADLEILEDPICQIGLYKDMNAYGLLRGRD